MVAVSRSVFWLAALGLAGFLLGCGKTTEPSASAPPGGPRGMFGNEPEFDAESGPFAAGKKVLVENGCFRCHTVNGARARRGGGPPMMGGGPGGPGGPEMAGRPRGPGGPPPEGEGRGPGGPPPGEEGRGPDLAGGRRGPGGGPGMMGGRMGGTRGPDLGTVGGYPEHTVTWLMEYIRNPKSKRAEARMPPFEGKIKDADLKALAEYLASLK